MRTSQNPFGDNTPFTDKLIGNAYDVVKYVAYYIKEIRYVAYNMENIYRVSQELRANALLKTAINAVGTNYEIPLPQGVSAGMVLASNVNIFTSEGEIYGPAESNFSWKISEGKLIVTIPLGAPSVFVGGEIRWMLTWNTPTVGA